MKAFYSALMLLSADSARLLNADAEHNANTLRYLFSLSSQVEQVTSR